MAIPVATTDSFSTKEMKLLLTSRSHCQQTSHSAIAMLSKLVFTIVKRRFVLKIYPEYAKLSGSGHVGPDDLFNRHENGDIAMTNKTLAGLLADCDKTGLIPCQVITARIAALGAPLSVAAANGSLKSAISAAFQKGSDPLKEAKNLRLEHEAYFRKAESALQECEAKATSLVLLAAFVDGEKASLPRNCDPRPAEAATSVRAAREAGHNVAPSLSEDLKDAGRTALRKIKAMDLLTKRRRAAHALAYAKNMSTQMERFAKLPQDKQKAAVFERSSKRFAASAQRYSVQYEIAKKAHMEAK